jgi:hypothetical protein
MEKELLEKLISEGLSTYEISAEIGKGQTTTRYWLRKYGLNTQNLSQSKDFKNTLNGKKCLSCQKDLVGAKSHYCSNTCKALTSYHSQPNTNERQKKVSRERKLKLIEMSGGGCEICGYKKNYSALQFHHLNRSNKVFCLDSRKLSNTNWNSIVKEWEKCQLLCATCHIEVHNPDNLVI